MGIIQNQLQDNESGPSLNNIRGKRRSMQVKTNTAVESHKSLFSDPLAYQIKGIILKKP
jgi:hypothetical protein